MGKLTEAIQRNQSAQGPKCGVATLLTKVNKDIRKELLDALADQSVQHSALARALGDLGYGA